MAILHHDYPSAASLRAVLGMQQLLVRGADVTFHGIDVLGLATALPATMDDLEDWSRHRDELALTGWDLPRPRRHPPTLPAHMIERSCPDSTTAMAWRTACYHAHWLEGRDIGDGAVLADLGATIGLTDLDIPTLVGDRVRAAGLRRQMIAVRGDGVGGVPVLDVAGTKVSPFMPMEDLALLVAL